MFGHEYYMQLAIRHAHQHKTPYGALLLEKSTHAFILEANSTKTDGKTAHAEMNVIRRKEAHKLFNDSSQLILYTTGEPCPMCMGAIIWTGIPVIHFGLPIQDIRHYHKQILVSSEKISENAWYNVKIHQNLCYNDCKELFDLYT